MTKTQEPKAQCQAAVWGTLTHSPCGKTAKVQMTGKIARYNTNAGEEKTVDLCGVHANQARKSRSVQIATTERKSGFPRGWDTISLEFEAAEIEKLKAERKELGDPSRPIHPRGYATLGEVIYQNADAIAAIIGPLPTDARLKALDAIASIDGAFRNQQERIDRLAEVEARIAEMEG